jgi:uncharacterized protein (TIGR02231 family)
MRCDPFRILIALVCTTATLTAAVTEVGSRITTVTVFTDRAQVSRRATVTLGRGRHTVVFTGLPAAIDPASVRVSGSGGAVLHDIRLERVHQTETADEELRELESALLVLQDSLRVITDHKDHAQKEKAFVQKIADGVASPGGKEVPAELEPDKWVKMVTFYRERLDALAGQIRRAERKERTLQKEIDKLKRQIAEVRQGGARSTNRVQVALEVKKPGAMTLTASYLVHGPGWTPLYDIRMSSADKTMTVVYKAQVRQNTSEDWKDVAIRLSTARPRAGGSHPELSPWYVRFPQPRPSEPVRRMSKVRSAPMQQMMDNRMPQEAEEQKLESLSASMDVATAAIETKSTSVEFVPSGTTTVKSDNQPYTVTVTEAAFPAAMRYSTVPKLSPRAYLKAKVDNSSDYPFLAGRTNIFLDGAFVSHGTMETVAPGEEFWTFLGIDEAIGVEHKLVKRYEKREGVITKKECIVYEYLITVTNNKKSDVDVVVWDQVPIATNEEIEVELVRPEYEQDTDTLKKNEHDFLEWLLTLKPGEKREIPLVFSVTYPKGRSVNGL